MSSKEWAVLIIGLQCIDPRAVPNTDLHALTVKAIKSMELQERREAINA